MNADVAQMNVPQRVIELEVLDPEARMTLAVRSSALHLRYICVHLRSKAFGPASLQLRQLLTDFSGGEREIAGVENRLLPLAREGVAQEFLDVGRPRSAGRAGQAGVHVARERIAAAGSVRGGALVVRGRLVACGREALPARGALLQTAEAARL